MKYELNNISDKKMIEEMQLIQNKTIVKNYA